jgi:hypothetical protein
MPALRLSGTAALGTPPRKSNALTCAPIQSGKREFHRYLKPAVLIVDALGCPWRHGRD